jgi:hypothetical protein
MRPQRWEDCQFLELRDGRIQISVKSKEVFAAKTRDEETQRLTAMEAGERETVRSEEYDLRVFGLANDSGVPTADWSVLLDFLRGAGKLYSRGDDKDVTPAQRAVADLDGHGFWPVAVHAESPPVDGQIRVVPERCVGRQNGPARDLAGPLSLVCLGASRQSMAYGVRARLILSAPIVSGVTCLLPPSLS